MTALRWISTSFVIAVGTFLLAGGLGVATELIVIDRRADAVAGILGALLIATGFILRPFTPTHAARPPKTVRVLASIFVMALGGLLVAHDFADPPVHSDAAAFEILLGILMLIAGLVLRPGAERAGGSK